MASSIDFRRKVLSIKEREQWPFEAIAQGFGVWKASVVRWSKDIEVRRTRQKPATKIEMKKLRPDVEPYPDAYQYERAQGLEVSQRGMGYALKRLRISRKKTFSHPKADVVARNHFKEQIEAYQSTHQQIVYLDESSFAHDMPRRSGYAPRGERCLGQHNWHAKGRIHVIGTLCASCLLTVSLFTGSIHTHTFSAWVAQDLWSQLPPQSVIVMDHAAFHKRADIRQLFEGAGYLLEYRPAYSPDFNPIEHQWAQAQAIRKQKNCSIEALFAHYVSSSFYIALAICRQHHAHSSNAPSSLAFGPRRLKAIS